MGDAERRQRLILYAVGGSGLVMLAVVLLFFALSGGGSGADVAEAASRAGCTFQTFPNQGRDHTDNLNEKVDHNSFPPTSGRHYFTPAVWDLYERPVNQLQLVHNLEHGGIVIQYGDEVPESSANEIVGFYRDDPNGLIVAPLPALGDKIALTAWTHLMTCTRFDRDAFTTFRDAYRGRGPERFDLDALQPGT